MRVRGVPKKPKRLFIKSFRLSKGEKRRKRKLKTRAKACTPQLLKRKESRRPDPPISRRVERKNSLSRTLLVANLLPVVDLTFGF